MTTSTHCPTLSLPATDLASLAPWGPRLRDWFQRYWPASNPSLPAMSAHLLRDLNLHENGSAGLGLERELARLEQQKLQLFSRRF